MESIFPGGELEQNICTGVGWVVNMHEALKYFLIAARLLIWGI